MMRNLFLILTAFYLIIGCEKIDSPFKVTNYPISKDIVDSTIWKKSNKYIIDKTDFTITNELVIQEGTVIVIKKGCSITVKDEGFISAQGSLTNPVIFTSTYDKDFGSEPNKTLVAPGNWNNIIVKGKNRSVFNLCHFYYGGGGISPSTIEIGDSIGITITNCLFKYNKGGKIDQLCGVIDASDASQYTYIKYNTLYHNELPITINSIINIDNTNIFFDSKSGNSNTYNTVLLNSFTPVDRRVEWTISTVALSISGPQLFLTKSAVVLWGNGTILKFDKNCGLRVECDTLNLYNTDGPGVFFTSLTDDQSLGDSNGDKIATSPQNGDWNGISDSIGRQYHWPNIKYAANSSIHKK